jgi:hypothetical protein
MKPSLELQMNSVSWLQRNNPVRNLTSEHSLQVVRSDMRSERHEREGNNSDLLVAVLLLCRDCKETARYET